MRGKKMIILLGCCILFLLGLCMEVLAQDVISPQLNVLLSAGNPNEKFGSDTNNTYYRNGTRQTENWINISANITDDVAIDNVVCEWRNSSGWYNFSMTNDTTDVYDIRITDQQTWSGYTFNIYANDTSGNTLKYNWTYYDHEDDGNMSSWGTQGQWRKYVGLNYTAEEFSYKQFYIHNYSYSSTQQDDRALPHEQPTDGTTHDTGVLRYSQPTNYNERYCNSFVGAYIDESITINESTAISDTYFHIWWTITNEDSGLNQINVDFEFDSTFNPSSIIARRIYINTTTSKASIDIQSERYSSHLLEANWLNFSINGTDNSLYVSDNNISLVNFGFGGGPFWPSIISTPIYSSFVIFNLPDNTTLQGLDTDSDGVNDYNELFVKYTDPKDSDTDNDNTNDFYDYAPLDPSSSTVPVNRSKAQVARDEVVSSMDDIGGFLAIFVIVVIGGILLVLIKFRDEIDITRFITDSERGLLPLIFGLVGFGILIVISILILKNVV